MTDDHARRSITMVGGPHTGKSHFTFQLYQRLRSRRGELSLREMPNEDLFREGLERISNGYAALHTSISKYDDADLRLADNTGQPFDLLWPDYGGEQISRIIQQRGVQSSWRDRLSNTEGLMLFIRPAEILDYKDLIQNPIELRLEQRIRAGDITEDSKLEIESQVGIIEMLQMLLWSAERNSATLMRSPKLGVILTCWDEIEETEKQKIPATVLQERLPLLDQFIRANWQPEATLIQGLSSLNCTLDDKVQNTEFRDLGPEKHGYVVAADGQHDADLTLLVSRMVALLNES